MADFREQCKTCQKAGHVPKFGWVWSCPDEKCDYVPCPTIKELQTVVDSAVEKEE